MKEKRLGMGLDALLGSSGTTLIESTETLPEAPLQEIPLDQLRPNPYQPRTEFNEEEIRSLAESIRKSGILQPILVRKRDGFYEIVAGERRFRAAKLSGLARIPVTVRPITDQDMLTVALAENIQRKDLNPIEKARAFRQLMQHRSWTQEQASEALGLARPTVSNFIRLLDLPPEIQEAVSRGTISMGHARALAAITNRAQLARLLLRIVNEDLSVRSLEQTVASENRAARKLPKKSKESYLEDLERKLSDVFGTKTEIRRKGDAGEIAIHYYSNEQLTGLLQQFGVQDTI